MPCDGRMYAHQLEGLADLVSPSVSVLSGSTFAESAQSLLASIDGPFVLAGTAYGGCLAMEVLGSAPERLRGLWLMNCHPGVHPFPDAVRSTSWRIRAGEHEAVIAEFAENAIPSGDADAKAAFIQMARETGADVFARQSDATLTRSDRWSTLAASTVPTLLIWGTPIASSLPKLAVELPRQCHRPSLSHWRDADISQRWSGHLSAQT